MDDIWQRPEIIAHSACMARSFRRFTGRDLMPGLFNPLGLSRSLFEAPFIIVSHGTEADPVLNYGNAAAMKLWHWAGSPMSTDNGITRLPCAATSGEIGRAHV